MININKILQILCAPPGVAGRENAASEEACRLLREYIPDAEVDKFGTVKGIIKHGENLQTILLDAHIDEVGMVVNFINEKGFIKASGIGGLDRRILPAASVTIWGAEALRGVICTLPPHVQSTSGGGCTNKNKTIKEDEIYIDCGYTKEELKGKVSLGDIVTVDGEFIELHNDRISSRALDDRAGIAVILYALDLLKNKPLKYNIAVNFSAQEELGCRGAGIAAYEVNPELAITVDVSYGDFPGSEKNTVWKLGKGGMIGCAPVLDRDIFRGMKTIAKAKNILHQIEIMSGKTGTNADVISLVKSGVRTGILSIPLRNMHTPVEVVQVSDIEAAGKLIFEFISGADEPQ